MKTVQSTENELIGKLIVSLNSLELAPFQKNAVIRDISNGVYIVLNTGEENLNNCFYIDYNTGGLSKHALFLSSLPGYDHRFNNPEKIKSIIDSFIASAGNANFEVSAPQMGM